MHSGATFTIVFLAAMVEAVEALTIVLAVGVTRGWRSPLKGTGAALLALGAVIAALGPALTSIPLNALRLTMGGVLAIFGLQWLRKATLRASGLKALHDEDLIYAKEMEDAKNAGAVTPRGTDPYAFRVAFLGVFLEGLEVAFIVITFGSTEHQIPLAAAGAGAAVLLVTALGLVVHKPLARVPENLLKYVVGVMLTSFGILWGVEGTGAKWPGHDLAVLPIIAGVVALSLTMVAALRRLSAAQTPMVARFVNRPN